MTFTCLFWTPVEIQTSGVWGAFPVCLLLFFFSFTPSALDISLQLELVRSPINTWTAEMSKQGKWKGQNVLCLFSVLSHSFFSFHPHGERLPSEHEWSVTQKEMWSFMIYCFIIFNAISVHSQIQGKLQDILEGQHFLHSFSKGQITYHYLPFSTYKAFSSLLDE